jgi:hypothetical protein
MNKPKELDTERIEKAIVLDETIDVALDKRLNRKFDIHILPWLFGIWYLANIHNIELNTKQFT